jgi:hypothetical protein
MAASASAPLGLVVAGVTHAEHARAVAKAVCLHGHIGVSASAAERNRVRFLRADLVTCVCELASGTRQSSRLLSESAQVLRRWVATALPPGIYIILLTDFKKP